MKKKKSLLDRSRGFVEMLGRERREWRCCLQSSSPLNNAMLLAW